MYIIKNQVNKVPLTLSEKATQPFQDWLFEFTNQMTGEVKYCSATNISVWISRYNLFEITDNQTEDPYNGTLDFKPTGSWKYKVYEMPIASPPLLIPTGNYGIAEEGDLLVEDPNENIEINFNAQENKDNGVFDA